MIAFPNIDPVMIHIGPLAIRWYAVAYLVGFILGWRYCLWLAKQNPKGPSPKLCDDFLTWSIISVILGGRIGYVLFYQPESYFSDPLEVFKIWHGGMSFHGAALAVIIAIWLYARLHKISFLALGDLVVCVVPIGLFFGRIANFINGELFGRVTDVPWGVIFPRGGDLPRHPSQIYESFLEGLVLFVVLAALAQKPALRQRYGFLSGVFFAGYGLARFSVEFFREPDAQLGYLLGDATMGQLLCVPMVLFGGYLMKRSARA